jgi:hypothetical protein
MVGTGTISGTVVNGTTGGNSIAGAEVVLRASHEGAFVPVAETLSDTNGRFTFEGLPIETGAIYLPGVNRDGVHYPGPRVRLKTDRSTAQLKLIAFDTIESPSPLICRRHEIDVQAHAGFLEISELLVIDNPSVTTFIGQQNGDAMPVTLRLSLPEGFDKVTFDKEFHGRNFKILDGRLTTDLPWPPGSRELKFTYRLPAEQGRAKFARILDRPTEQIVVRVGGMDVEHVACNLPAASAGQKEEVTFASRGAPLPAGHQFELQLGAIPIRFEAYGRWIAVGLLTVLVSGSIIALRRGGTRWQQGQTNAPHGGRRRLHKRRTLRTTQAR